MAAMKSIADDSRHSKALARRDAWLNDNTDGAKADFTNGDLAGYDHTGGDLAPCNLTGTELD